MEKGFLEGIKLNGPNYNVWKFKMRVVLQAQGLFSILQGIQNQPIDSETQKYAQWCERDYKVQSLRVITIDQHVMTHLFSTNTSAEMWMKLTSIYEKRSSNSLH